MPTPRYNGQPSQAADIPAMCKLYVGIEPTLDEHYDRLRVQMHDRVQSRIDKNNAPDAMVKRYARLMSESTFPAILVTQDGHIVDGNTRTRAHGSRNERYIRAWTLAISWETADPSTKEKLLLLSLALNSMNGLPLDQAEMLNYAAVLIRQGASDEEIMGRTGLPMAKISALRDRQRATERLTQIGVNVDTLNLPEAALRAFGKPNAMRLDDDMFSDLLNLTRDAGLKGGQVNSLATSLNEQTSLDSRRERLARERQSLEPQILANRGGQAVPMQCDWLLGVITKLLDKPITAFVESDPEKITEYSDMLLKGVDRLQEISALQQGRQPPMTATIGHEATH